MQDPVAKVINSLTPAISKTDQLNLKRRIQSFTVPAWFMKPLDLNPIECAKSGWALISNDTLQCTTCLKIATPANPEELKSLHSRSCHYSLFEDEFTGCKLEDPWIKTNYGFECGDCFMKVGDLNDKDSAHRVWCPRRMAN